MLMSEREGDPANGPACAVTKHRKGNKRYDDVFKMPCKTGSRFYLTDKS